MPPPAPENPAGAAAAAAVAEEDEDEEDDYLSMTFTSTPSKAPETSLQRSSRLRKSASTRGYNPPKPSLPTLSQNAIPDSNKGSQILSRMGFQPGQVLGKPSSSSSALKVPISVSMKADRGGLGLDTEKKRKFEAETEGIKKRRQVETEEFVEGKRRERREREDEEGYWRGMKVLEYFEEENGEEEEEGEGQKGKDEGLKAKNVLYRGLVKRRLEGERERGMRGRIEGRLSGRLGGYEEDEGEGLVYGDEVEEGFEEVDEELEEFERGSFAERLERITGYLREKYRYCFWCGFRYPDEGMEGCPGLSREEHDEG